MGPRAEHWEIPQVSGTGYDRWLSTNIVSVLSNQTMSLKCLRWLWRSVDCIKCDIQFKKIEQKHHLCRGQAMSVATLIRVVSVLRKGQNADWVVGNESCIEMAFSVTLEIKET